MTAKEARELINSTRVKEKCNPLHEVYAMIEMSSKEGVSYLPRIRLMPDDYYKLCDEGYIIKSMDIGYSIQW